MYVLSIVVRPCAVPLKRAFLRAGSDVNDGGFLRNESMFRACMLMNE